jgi:hypothetical protein
MNTETSTKVMSKAAKRNKARKIKRAAAKDTGTSVESAVQNLGNVMGKVSDGLVRPDQPKGTFDPMDELDQETIKKCYEKAEDELTKDNDMKLNLEKSDITVPGQNWILVSFVGKNCTQKTDRLGMKIWGCFDTPEKAKAHAMDLNHTVANKIFDIYILEMYTWAIIPPDPECIDDQNYHEEKLHDLITEHKRQSLRAKQVFDTRKSKLQDNPDVNEYKTKKSILEGLKPDELQSNPNADKVEKFLGKSVPLPKLEIVKEDIETKEVLEVYPENNVFNKTSVEEDETEPFTILEETNDNYNSKFYDA